MSQLHQQTPTLVTLLTLGDCNTKGTPPEQALSDCVSRRLRAAGYPCTASNWGHTMTTTREGLARVLYERPVADVVIINYGLVDSWVTSVPALYVSYYPETPLRRLGRKLLKFAKRRLRSPWIRRWIPTGEVVGPEEYERNLYWIVSALQHANPGATFVFWSTPPVQNNASRNANILLYNARMQSIAATLGAEFIDSWAELATGTGGDGYLDAVHLSSESFERLSRAIVNKLLSRWNVAREEVTNRAA